MSRQVMPKSKGSWGHRIMVRFLAVMLAVLIYWLLGFMVQDIRTIKGPDYSEIEKRHVDQSLVQDVKRLEEKVGELTRKVENQREALRLVDATSHNLQQTINQLLELRKLGIEKSVAFSDTEQENFTRSLNLFLDNQRKYQEMNQELYALIQSKRDVEDERTAKQKQIDAQREPAGAEFRALSERHRSKLAAFQLAILLPLLAAAAYLAVAKRASIYFPVSLAFAGATLIKVGLVIHEYYPRRYFKYILIAASLLVVLRILIHFIRAIAFPKATWLLKQYREAYERFLCPVCEYPIRTGPRRYLFWTRRTVNRHVLPSQGADAEPETYTCPSCGTALFEECDQCHKIRHSLLPNCLHCGAAREAIAE